MDPLDKIKGGDDLLQTLQNWMAKDGDDYLVSDDKATATKTSLADMFGLSGCENLVLEADSKSGSALRSSENGSSAVSLVWNEKEIPGLDIHANPVLDEESATTLASARKLLVEKLPGSVVPNDLIKTSDAVKRKVLGILLLADKDLEAYGFSLQQSWQIPPQVRERLDAKYQEIEAMEIPFKPDHVLAFKDSEGVLWVCAFHGVIAAFLWNDKGQEFKIPFLLSRRNGTAEYAGGDSFVRHYDLDMLARDGCIDYKLLGEEKVSQVNPADLIFVSKKKKARKT